MIGATTFSTSTLSKYGNQYNNMKVQHSMLMKIVIVLSAEFHNYAQLPIMINVMAPHDGMTHTMVSYKKLVYQITAHCARVSQ
jgi:hypothetical protein